ncbi:Hypothetical_protein [Hexamita inflata]|nr:Hypothetical protein HINF_LOCUS53285 [Hexamita inflata]CAI9965643.1 Hypothetical protein HINF_LOCUS53288 [Hexamita inflata]
MYKTISSVRTCQASCPKYFVTNITNNNSKQCVASCNINQVLNGSECKPKCTANCMNPVVKTTLIVVLPIVTFIIVATIITAAVCRKKNSKQKLQIKLSNNYTAPAFSAV